MDAQGWSAVSAIAACIAVGASAVQSAMVAFSARKTFKSSASDREQREVQARMLRRSEYYKATVYDPVAAEARKTTQELASLLQDADDKVRAYKSDPGSTVSGLAELVRLASDAFEAQYYAFRSFVLECTASYGDEELQDELVVGLDRLQTEASLFLEQLGGASSSPQHAARKVVAGAVSGLVRNVADFDPLLHSDHGRAEPPALNHRSTAG